MHTQLVNGIHHITAIAGIAQRNVDFYTGLLGLRLVKKTVNFDAPEVYHLYYGDEAGSPGSIITFFPYGQLPRGRRGYGEVTHTSFSIPVKALSFWMDRLHTFNVGYEGPFKRFDEQVLRFEDYEGMGVELIATDMDARIGWANEVIPHDYAIRGFHSAILNEHSIDATVRLLTEVMNHQLVKEENGIYRFASGVAKPGNYINVKFSPADPYHRNGAGTVHHIAFATPTADSQLELREVLMREGYQATPVLDRNYFISIYFREPGGILFEVATNPPGFTIDESLATLGTALKLPDWYESDRKTIEKNLEIIHAKVVKNPSY